MTILGRALHVIGGLYNGNVQILPTKKKKKKQQQQQNYKLKKKKGKQNIMEVVVCMYIYTLKSLLTLARPTMVLSLRAP